MTFTTQDYQRALAMEREARAWITLNADAWDAVLNIAFIEHEAGRTFGMAYIWEQIRKVNYTDITGKDTHCSNNLKPAIGRILTEQYPELKQHLRLKKSYMDALNPDATIVAVA